MAPDSGEWQNKPMPHFDSYAAYRKLEKAADQLTKSMVHWAWTKTTTDKSYQKFPHMKIAHKKIKGKTWLRNANQYLTRTTGSWAKNPNASEAGYKPKQSSYIRTKLFFMRIFLVGILHWTKKLYIQFFHIRLIA